MSRIKKIIVKIIISLFVVACSVILLSLVYQVVFWNYFFTNDKYIASYDNQYVYLQLSSPEKTMCTIIIFENDKSQKYISHTLPYFNERTMGEIAWGLNSNDLFVDSRDTGLAVYRVVDGNWVHGHTDVEDNLDGTLTYSIYIDGIKHELSDDTIPSKIKDRIIEIEEKYHSDNKQP